MMAKRSDCVEDEACKQAMNALDELAEVWAKKVNLPHIANVLTVEPTSSRIEAMLKQAYIEGAYRHFCAVKDGEVPGMLYIGNPKSEGVH